MLVDVASERFSFGFAPHSSGEFGEWSENVGGDPYLQTLAAQVSEATAGQACWPSGLSAKSLSAVPCPVFAHVRHGELLAI
jgi:hypothetical protein